MQVEVSPKLGKTLNLMLTESQEFRRKISKHGYPIKIDQVQEAMVLGGRALFTNHDYIITNSKN